MREGRILNEIMFFRGIFFSMEMMGFFKRKALFFFWNLMNVMCYVGSQKKRILLSAPCLTWEQEGSCKD